MKDTTPLASPVAPRRAATYQVKRGDTLAAIARKTGTTIAQLMKWNSLGNANVRVGARLVVQAPKAPAAKASSASPTTGKKSPRKTTSKSRKPAKR